MSPDEIKEIMRKLDLVENQVRQMHTVLLGVPDSEDKGLVGKVNDVCTNHVSLKNRVYLITGILASSGILTASGVGIWRMAV